MALTDTAKKVDKKSEGEKKAHDGDKKPHETHRPLEKKEKPLTKVIVRRLPPTMDQATFLNQISPAPDYDYMYMVRGDASLGENAFSRVYLNFTKPEEIFDFKEKFDNYVFIDGRGHEYPAVVEFAAFQKIPKKRNKNRVDPKSATMETDPIYLEFLESLNKPQETEVKAEFSYQISNETKSSSNQDSTTPLLEYIKNKRAEKMRIREERREERKRKELERRRIRDDERRKRYEEKSPIKTVVIKPHSKLNAKDSKFDGDSTKVDKDTSHESTKSYDKSPYYKTKEKRFDDRRRDGKTKYVGKKEFTERREYKNRRDDYKDRDYKDRDYKSKYDDRKDSETKSTTKKVKKYSEKREERKVEAQKAEQKKSEESAAAATSKPESKPVEVTPPKTEDKPKSPEKCDDSKITDAAKPASPEIISSENKSREKETEGSSQKRIRNKDRPTLAIYRPGMLSKRKQTDCETETKEVKTEPIKE